MIDSKIDDLVQAVQAAGIRTTAQFEALAVRLSPPERNLFLALAETPEVAAHELRRQSDGLIANLSLTAVGINRKLASAGDSRHVVCRVESLKQGRGTIAWWRLADDSDDSAGGNAA